MARKPRIQYPGAIYHILSRGNYRKDLFSVTQSGVEFEKALFEACESCGWRLHAYVIMSNHYHLALETPKGNLAKRKKILTRTRHLPIGKSFWQGNSENRPAPPIRG